MITAYRLFGWVAAAAAGWWALEGAIRLGWGEGSRSLFAAGAAAVAAATLASCRWRARWWSDADKLDASRRRLQGEAARSEEPTSR